MTQAGKYIALVTAGILACAALGVAAKTTDGRVALTPAPKSGTSASIQTKINRLETATKTKLSDIRAELRGKVLAIGDARRRDAALAVIGQFSHSNTIATDHFANVLNHLEKVLGKVESRAQKAEAGGGNVTAVRMAVGRAKESIAQARTAVSIQAKKSYQTAINARSIPSSESSTPEGQNNLISSMRGQFQAARTALKNDLFALRDGPMKNARRAVQDAIKALMQVPDVDKNP